MSELSALLRASMTFTPTGAAVDLPIAAEQRWYVGLQLLGTWIIPDHKVALIQLARSLSGVALGLGATSGRVSAELAETIVEDLFLRVSGPQRVKAETQLACLAAPGAHSHARRILLLLVEVGHSAANDADCRAALREFLELMCAGQVRIDNTRLQQFVGAALAEPPAALN